MNERQQAALEVIGDLCGKINDLLMEVPGHHITTTGTRVALAEGPPVFNDTGLDLVLEFQRLFGAHVAMEPRVPDFSSGYAAGQLAHYLSVAEPLAEQLKVWAQKARDTGDEAGALVLIRVQLCQEELAELARGILNRDIVECLDALTDMTYVSDGAYITLGLAPYKLAALHEVHRSNMSKMGPDGRPVTSSAGRIVKGPDYSPPDLRAVLGMGPERFNYREPGEFGEGATVVRGKDRG